MEKNKQSAIEFLKMIMVGNIDEAYEKYINMSGKHHNVFTSAGMPALQKGMKDAHVQFPHKQFTIQHVLGDGDLVAVHSRLALEENKPAMSVVHLFRFEDKKIVEMWDIGQSPPNNSLNTDGVF